ncbi:hypothetical protein KIM372_06830 [Bombiscardovia nodaiensis]|uniref:ABC transporter permease n=1 Tax=Bombiscardovia nodaiensis TaxID=2932181 RepID=A0ABN6SD80_9BIFI|nr:hypothetical protein KIM372_06830 [Bombiscardovia nodaiensis]
MASDHFDMGPILAAIRESEKVDAEPIPAQANQVTQPMQAEQSRRQAAGPTVQLSAQNSAGRQEAIAAIVSKGLPKRQGLWATLVDMSRSLGFKHLLFGVWDCVFLGLVGSALAWLILVVLIEQDLGVNSVGLVKASAISIFVLSPATYQAILLLVHWKERSLRVSYLTGTSRWSIRQITSVRMLCFGLVSMVGSALVSWILAAATRGALDGLKLLGISFASLFLYACLQVCLDMFGRSRLALLLPTALWLAVGVGLWLGRTWSVAFLLGLPAALSLGVGGLAALLFLGLLGFKCAANPALQDWLFHGPAKVAAGLGRAL